MREKIIARAASLNRWEGKGSSAQMEGLALVGSMETSSIITGGNAAPEGADVRSAGL